MSFLLCILLSIFWGIAELLPLSYTGHITAFTELLGLKYAPDDNLFFEGMLRLGTLIALCLVYKKELGAMINGTVALVRGEKTDAEYSLRLTPPVRLLTMILLGSVPALIGSFWRDDLAALNGSTVFVGIAFIAVGFIIFCADKFLPKGTKNGKTMSMFDAFAIGIGQLIAVLPGVSRVGVTFSLGLSRGISRSYSLRFSMLLWLPTLLFVALRDISAGFGDISLIDVPISLLGCMLSAFFSLISLNIMRRLIGARGALSHLSWYIWAVGALTLILTLILK